MEQITCLQPKELVTVSFLKNICEFFIDSTMSQRLELKSFKKMNLFYLSQEASQGKASEKMSFHVYHQEQR